MDKTLVVDRAFLIIVIVIQALHASQFKNYHPKAENIRFRRKIRLIISVL